MMNLPFDTGRGGPARSRGLATEKKVGKGLTSSPRELKKVQERGRQQGESGRPRRPGVGERFADETYVRTPKYIPSSAVRAVPHVGAITVLNNRIYP